MKNLEVFEEEFNIDTNLPHISNLNEDNQLNNRVLYSLDRPKTIIGKKKGN